MSDTGLQGGGAGGGPATQIRETGGPATLDILAIPDGQFLKRSGTTVIGASPAGAGTVTSVGMTVPAFLSISGSPIIAAGTLAVGLSGTALPIASGGTAGTSAAGARSSLATAQSGANSDITSITGLVTPLAIGQGGTSATTAAGALANLGGVGGTAAANQIAVGSGANTLTSFANFTFLSGVPSNNFGALSHTEVWGSGAGAALTAGGTDNTFLGFGAGAGITAANQSCAFGSGALAGGASAGNNNNAFGYFAMNGTLASGHDNNAFGHNAGKSLTSGSYNQLFGGDAGQALTTGRLNQCWGDGAGFSLTTQGKSVIIGDDAGRLFTAAFDGIIFIGHEAGTNHAGSFGKNTVVGFQAMSGSGVPANNTANDCTIMGYRAGNGLTSGSGNCLFGNQAGFNLTTGGDNLLIGTAAGFYALSAFNNIALGSAAYQGDGVTAPTGSNNFALGYFALAQATTCSNNVCIGTTAGGGFSGGLTTGSGNVMIGSAAGDSTANNASARFVSGSNTATISDVFFGNGEKHAAPAGWTLRSTAATGTNTTGAAITVAPGPGTGTGVGGAFVVQTAPAGSTGTTPGTLVERLRVAATGIVSIGTIGTTFAGNVIAGVQTALAAVSGQVGELISATNSTYTNAAATGAYGNITSVTLTPGDWDISGFVTLSANGSTLTVTANSVATISTTTASAAGTTEGLGDIAYVSQVLNAASGKDSFVLRLQVNISATTTYFLNAQSTYTLGNPQFVGGLTARRLR